jgi:hypothetical protein
MFTTTTTSRRCGALLAIVLVAVAVLPATVFARPIDGPGMPHPDAATGSESVPTVVRTVVRQQSVPALPIALAGAALLVAIAGTGYALVRIAPLRQQLGVGH